MNKNSQFRLSRRDGKVVMTDTENNEYILTAVQAERLAHALQGEVKSLKYAHRLKRLVRRAA